MEKLLIVYWTGTGNTEIMAEKIKEGAIEAGASVDVKRVDEVDEIIVDDYNYIALGCPSMGNEELEEEEFLPFFESVKSKLIGKKLLYFGSYGWGDGEWMENWVHESLDFGLDVYLNKGIISYDMPDDEVEEECILSGKEFMNY